MPRQVGNICLCGSVMAIAISVAGPALAHGTTERVNLGPGGVQANFYSEDASLSPDGRFVAFASAASNLVPGDTNDAWDVFVRDRQTGTTRRVSVQTGGGQGNDYSYAPGISANGRIVAFYSDASNLVPGDTNGAGDVFVHDRKMGTTQRVSLGPGGGQGNSGSFYSAISADGRFIAFYSNASNLVRGDTNGETDVFVHDRQTGTTWRVSVGTGGNQADSGSGSSAISTDGRFIAFASIASNLVPGDTNGAIDVFVRDREKGITDRASVGPRSVQGDRDSFQPALSADGRFVAFVSEASNLVSGDTNGVLDVFVRDRQTGTTKRVSLGPGGVQANGFSEHPALSPNGRFVAFDSEASNLVPNDTNGEPDVFVHDCQTGTTRRVSVRTGGSQANAYSISPALSANGRFIAFESGASNLVPGDTNGLPDVFVRILVP